MLLGVKGGINTGTWLRPRGIHCVRQACSGFEGRGMDAAMISIGERMRSSRRFVDGSLGRTRCREPSCTGSAVL